VKRAAVRQILTPNIDRLAGESVVFGDAHTIYPICNPSRIALWTGTRPTETGLDTNSYASFRNRPGLADIVTMQQNLRNNGYYTTGLGKVFHSPRGDVGIDEELSWDQWIHRLHGAKGPWIPSVYSPGSSTWPFGESPFPLEEQYDYLNADHAARLLESGVSSLPHFNSNNPVLVELPSEGPFMIGLGIYLPHKPFVAPTEALALFDTDDMGLDANGLTAIFEDLGDLSERGLFYTSTNASGSSTGAFTSLLRVGVARDGEGGDVNAWREMVKHYLASIVVADRSVGRVLDALDNGPYADNTVVVLHSDHGYQLGEKNVLGKNTLWDDSTRSVLMFRVPGVSPKRIEETVSLQDVYPTVSSLAGLSTPDHVKYKDLSPMLASADAISTQPVLSVQGRVESKRYALITEQFRYLRFGAGLDDAELYDRQSDPDDAVNLIYSPDHQHVRSTMNVLLENALVLEDGPPVLLPLLEQEHAVGESVHVEVKGWHALGDAITYEASNLPIGLSIDSVTGIISGIPESTGVTESEVSAVSDAGADTSLFDWTIDIRDVISPVWTGEGLIDFATVNSRSIELGWSGATDDIGVIAYNVVYQSGQAGVVERLVSGPAVSLTGLEPDTEYSIRIEALDAAGNQSDSGPTAVLRTDIEDLGPPVWALNTEVLATVTGSSSVSLAWPQAVDDNGVAGYRIDYVQNGLSVSATTFESSIVLESLLLDTEYTVSIVAWDILDKESLPIQTAFRTDPLPDTVPPVWPEGATVTLFNVTSNGLSVSWPAAEDASLPVSYRVTLENEAGTTLQTAVLQQTEAVFTDLQPTTRYSVSVQPRDSIENESDDVLSGDFQTVEETVDTPPIWNTAFIELLNVSEENAEVSWTGATDDNGVVDYLLTLTDLTTPEMPVRLASYSSSTAVIDDLLPATDYLLEVEARDGASSVSTGGPSLSFRTNDIPIPAEGLLLVVDGETRVLPIESFSSQDRGPGSANLSSDGSSVALEGNIWKRVKIDFDMTADSVIEFDFAGIVEGEVHGIGFETDNSPSSSVLIKLWGTERYGLRDLATYGGEGVQRFRIRVGEHFFARRYDWLTLVSDHDRLPRDASASFSGIRLSSTGNTEPDVSPPVWTLATLGVDEITYDSARLEWAAATDDNSTVSYSVWLDGEFVDDTTEAMFELTTLAPETTHVVEVDAFDAAGNRSTRITAVVLTLPLPPVDEEPPAWTAGSLLATAVMSDQVALQWPAANDNNSEVVFEVSSNGVEIETTSAGELIVDSLLPSTVYEFNVVAIDASGNRSAPLSVTVTTEISSTPSNLLPIPGAVYVSSSSNGTASSVAFADEDIIVLDESTRTWKMLFDGSDVGLLGDIDAFVFRSDGQILLSLDVPATLAGLGRVDDSDVLQFSPDSLGDDTSGVFSMFLDGSDVGLTAAGEDINALALSPNGDLLISVSGRFNVDGLVAEDEDIVRFMATSTGSDTQGEWELFVDGSDVGYASEDVWGMSWKDSLSLTFQSSYTAPFGIVLPWDIMSVDVLATGEDTTANIQSGLRFEGRAEGVRYETLNAIQITPVVPLNETTDVADGFNWTLPDSAKRSESSGLTWIIHGDAGPGLAQANALASSVFGIDGESYARPRYAVLINAEWNLVNPMEGVFDWSSVDVLVEEIRATAQAGVGFMLWPRIYGDYVPDWVEQKHEALFGTDPRLVFSTRGPDGSYLFNEELSGFISALSTRYALDPLLVHVDMRTAFDVENGEWAIKGEPQDGDDEAAENWTRAYHRLWGDAFTVLDADIGRLVGVIANPAYGAAALLPELFAAGMGQRDGQPSRRQIWDAAYATTVDNNGYVVVDDAAPSASSSSVRFSEVTEFSWTNSSFGPPETTYERFQAALLWALQVRRTWLGISPPFLRSTSEFPYTALDSRLREDYESAQDMIQWAQLQIGHTAASAPDAWSWPKATEYTTHYQNGPIASGDATDSVLLKNVERWLYQRDVADGGQTVPVLPMLASDLFGATRAGIRCGDIYCEEYRARRTDRATGNDSMYFSVDPAFLSAGPNDISIKVTYYDVADGSWLLEYRGESGEVLTTPVVNSTGTGRIRTVNLPLDGIVLDGGFPGGMDFRIRASDSGDATIRFVRIIR